MAERGRREWPEAAPPLAPEPGATGHFRGSGRRKIRQVAGAFPWLGWARLREAWLDPPSEQVTGSRRLSS